MAPLGGDIYTSKYFSWLPTSSAALEMKNTTYRVH